MQNILKAVFVSGAVLMAAASSHAQGVPLPGKTLQAPAAPQIPNRGGFVASQPEKNVKSVLGPVSSPLCPHIGKSLRDLLLYARANWPAIYRAAVDLRRTGFTQDQVRDWLENELCTAEGF
jgi:hypothetical protein